MVQLQRAVRCQVRVHYLRVKNCRYSEILRRFMPQKQ
jgi:hypothetical protein